MALLCLHNVKVTRLPAYKASEYARFPSKQMYAAGLALPNGNAAPHALQCSEASCTLLPFAAVAVRTMDPRQARSSPDTCSMHVHEGGMSLLVLKMLVDAVIAGGVVPHL